MSGFCGAWFPGMDGRKPGVPGKAGVPELLPAGEGAVAAAVAGDAAASVMEMVCSVLM